MLDQTLLSGKQLCPACIKTGSQRCGFSECDAAIFQHRIPSPADDHVEKCLDLNEHLVKHKEATFFVRVKGDSMIGASIFDNDILVVDKSLNPEVGRVVIAVVNGELTVKRLMRNDGKVWLVAENPAYAPIEMKDCMEFIIWGVVTNAIHAL